MMKKRTLISLLAVALIGVPLAAFGASRSIDSPHVNVDNNADTEDCSTCHFAGNALTCTDCHTNTTGQGYGDKTAPFVLTHQGAAPSFNCQVCHNPHVSKQYGNATALVSGQITAMTEGVDTDGTTKIMQLTLSNVSGPWATAPHTFADWAAKTGTDRGLTLWFTDGTDANGNPISYSFEVSKAISDTSIEVKGTLPTGVSVTLPTNFEMHYGQLIASKVGVDKASPTYDTDLANLQSYRQGLNDIYPLTGPDTFTDPAGTNGICQVCHTKTAHWRNDGSGNDHNVGARCTSCHTHSSGFMVTACDACHGKPPTAVAELATPSTGSQTAGAHYKHAVEYGYSCGVCHYGTGMDEINDPNNIVKGDKIQIGFDWAGYGGHLTQYNGQASVAAGAGYEGTNNTKVTATGTAGANDLKCSNVYCHSTGQSIRVGCLTPLPNTTPPWDGDMNGTGDPQGDGVRCNNCHGYTNASGDLNPMTSGSHSTHITANICSHCHANTTSDGVTINATGKSTYHANGSYDIAPSGTDFSGAPIQFTYDPATRTCSPVAGQSNFAPGCHSARQWAVRNDPDPSTCPDVCGAPAPLTYPTAPDPNLLSGGINLDPIVNYKVEQVSRNTFKITDTSIDPDLNDNVKNGCFGGGHDGAPGLLKLSTANPGKINALMPLDGSTNELYVTLESGSIDTSGAQPVVWYYYLLFDNNPLSKTNKANKTIDNPALAPIDGYVIDQYSNGNAGWQSIPWDLNFDDSQTNVLATTTVTPTVTDLGGGSYRLTLTPQFIDPDAYDLTKNALFGGHGHDKTVQARIKVYWGGPTPTTLHYAILDNADPNVTPDVPIEYTFTGKTPGSQLWYFVKVFDSHRQDATANAAFPTVPSDSGWRYETAP